MAEHHTETYYIKPLDNLIYQSEPIIMELNPCAICNRTFVPETLEKHIKICEKWATKKRRIFDSSRQRREGTEMATYLPKDFGLPPSKQTDSTIIQSTPSEVRIESSQPSTLHSQSRSPENNQPVQQQQQNYHQPRQKLVMTNNGKQGCAIKKSLSPTSRMTISHIAEIKARAEAKRHLAPVTEQCPECGRHFGIKAYDRHVEFCKEKSKISQFKGNNTSQAKERLEARTKYRAPNLRLKRAAVRDKYSVNGEDGHDENRMDDFLSMSNSLSSSFMSDGMQKESEENTEILEEYENTTRSGSEISVNLELLKTPKKGKQSEIKTKKKVNELIDGKTLQKLQTKTQEKNIGNGEIYNNLNALQVKGTVSRSISKIKDEQKSSKKQKNAISVQIKSENLIEDKQNSNHYYVTKEEIIPICKTQTLIGSSTYKLSFDDIPVGTSKNLPIFEDQIAQISKLPLSSKKNEKKLNLTTRTNIMQRNSYPSTNYNEINSHLPTPKSPLQTHQNDDNNLCSNHKNDSDKTISNCIYEEVSNRHIKQGRLPQIKDVIVNNKNKLEEDNIKDNFWMDVANLKNKKALGIPLTASVQGSEIKTPKNLCSKRGFSDKYDPFLSAKRQLEELCSPTATTTTKTNFAELKSPKTPLTPKNLTNSNTKKPLQESVSMSTSYTGPSTSSSINPTKTLNAVKSNFRRTSSLRAPRKITPSRPIFVPPSRTRPSTIQRGISDEGPISTNFIKPEEYDEMPVKSACINNFATSINSPRLKRDLSPRPRFLSDSSRESSPKTFKRDPSPLVVRRSSNSNLNRRNLRLNLSNGEDSLPSGVQKTDSLAVFLKYENELVRGLADASKTQECNNKQIATPEIMQRSNPTQPPVTEKDLKDKTNILSKQNSLKNSSNDLQVEKNFNFNFLNNEKDLKLSTLKSNSNLSDQQMNARNINYLESRPKTAEAYASINKILPIKLEPLPKSVVIKNSISNLSTPLKTSISSSASYNNTLAPLFPSIKPLNKNNLISHNVNNIINNSINITSIFSNSNTNYKDCSNYIDPKLINSCDNLKVTPAISIDDIKSNLSQDSCNSTKSALDKMNIKGNCVSKEDVNDNIDLSSFSSQMKRSKQDQQQDHSATCSRNSTISEKSNKLFKRQIRLGKNQFLYDASPTDSESSPDLIETDQISGNNNAIVNSNSDDRSTTLSSSSVIQTTPITQNLSQHNYEKEFESFLSPSINPIFDNFDFEEFLASFENNNENDDLFPGFKDCKEFLMNRCLNMRSNFNFNRNFHQYHNNTPCDSIRSQKTEAEQNFENKKRSQNEDEKHEIFISIETDQNENDDTLDVNSCPSDPSIMKNPEVEEINGNDNKFTKIETYHLPVFEEDKDNTLANFEIKTIPRDKFVKKIIQEENKNFENNNRDVVNYENLMVKAIESTNSDLYPVDSDEVSSVECYPVSRKSVKSKASSDSAYGSLSRNSPTSADQTSLHRASARGQNYLPSTSNTTSLGQIDDKTKILIKRSRELNTSSSGSENSLLPVVNNTYLQQQRQKENSSSKESSNNLNVKSDESDYNFTKDLSAKDLSNDSISNCNTKPMLSKFCYECGSKFLVATAKFCMECGVKRLAIE